MDAASVRRHAVDPRARLREARPGRRDPPRAGRRPLDHARPRDLAHGRPVARPHRRRVQRLAGSVPRLGERRAWRLSAASTRRPSPRWGRCSHTRSEQSCFVQVRSDADRVGSAVPSRRSKPVRKRPKGEIGYPPVVEALGPPCTSTERRTAGRLNSAAARTSSEPMCRDPRRTQSPGSRVDRKRAFDQRALVHPQRTARANSTSHRVSGPATRRRRGG